MGSRVRTGGGVRGAPRIPPARRALYLIALGALAATLATPVVRRIHGLVAGRSRMQASERHAELERRGMYAGDQTVAPVWLNQECMVDDRPAYDDYCARTFERADHSFCNVAFCRFGDITTTIDGFTGALDRVALRPKPAGVYRIVTLGGSTTGSFRWDEIWPGVLEGMLNRKARAVGKTTRFEVLNDGLAGSTSILSRHRFETWSRHFDPDLVILGEEVNDPCTTFQHTKGPDGRFQNHVADAYLHGSASAEELAALSPWFARHLPTYARWRDEIREGSPRAKLAAARVARSGVLGTGECRVSPLDPPPGTPSIMDDYTDGTATTIGEYERIHGMVDADGAELVVTTAPHNFRDWACPTLPLCAPFLEGHDYHRYITQRANPDIRDFAARHGLIVVDLERQLDALEAGERHIEIDPDVVPDDPQARERFANHLLRHRGTPPGRLRAELFTEEWMHPNPEGFHWVASEYFAALWPVLSERVP